MKKILAVLLVTVLCFTVAVSFTGCNNNTDQPATTPPASNTPSGDATDNPDANPDIDPSSVDVIGEVWRAVEFSFESTAEYKKAVSSDFDQFYVKLDVNFTNRETGTTITMPGFWDGEQTFKVRFAPTEYGIWDYKTVCADDTTLDGKTGSIGANDYKGDLDIYKHGFVTVVEGNKYFTYADGTPFFYLGDTHWNMLVEEFDKPGSHAGDIQTDSHFKYIVDKRVEQGFTVYQSEPIGHTWSLNDCKFGKSDLKGFQKADQYFAYIAEKGLVHANAQFVFVNQISQKFAEDLEFMELCSRMWIARFGAYPVMWTLAQECDNDDYHERGDAWFSFANNPWVNVAEFLHKYDPYQHPLTGHQENTSRTTVTGLGVDLNAANNLGRSIFLDEEVTKKTGHNWYGAQWSPSLTSLSSRDVLVAKDYWLSPKVGVNYEGRYCYLWTKDTGARAQGWFSYLNGFFGYGYGAIDIWLYKSTYNIDVTSNDGLETITVEDKAVHWSEAVEFPSAYQVGYMKHFFSYIEWWKLVPEFRENVYYHNIGTKDNYACATIGNDVYVVYLFNLNSSLTGTIGNMDADATYNAMWFNPRTCEYITIDTQLKSNTAVNGKPAYTLPDKPNGDTQDWVVLLIKNK